MAFHVYVDGPIERTTEAVQRLAAAMCQRYGLRASDVVARLHRGRFRVKANLDQDTADAYARDLEKIGARVVIEEVRDTSSPRTDAISLPPPSVRSAVQDTPAPRASDPPARPTPPSGGRVVVTKPPGRPYALSTPPTGTPSAQPVRGPASSHPAAQSPATATGRSAQGPARGQTPPSGRPVQSPPLAIEHPAASREAMPGPARASAPDTPGPTTGRAGMQGPAAPDAPGPTTSRAGMRGPARASAPDAPGPTTGRAGMQGPASSSQQPAQSSATARSGTIRFGMPLPGPAPITPTAPASRQQPPPPGPAALSAPLPVMSDGPGRQFSSGLAAAFSDQIPMQQLGALESEVLSLASVDGLEAGARSSAPSSPRSASFAPPAPSPEPPKRPTPVPAGSKERPKDIPLDLFAPPDLEGPPLQVELAVDDAEYQARKRASTPVPIATATPPAGRPSSPVLQRKPAPTPAAVPARSPAQRSDMPVPRWRFAAGVALAIVLGFMPAHLIAASREESAFRSIDASIARTQAAAETPDAYAKLDAFRADQLDRKQSERRAIALTSILIWSVLGAGLAYIWFRRIPWERFARS